MRARAFYLLLLLALALVPAGCASVDESADDQMESFHTTPEQPGDDHGWGTNITGVGANH